MVKNNLENEVREIRSLYVGIIEKGFHIEAVMYNEKEDSNTIDLTIDMEGNVSFASCDKMSIETNDVIVDNFFNSANNILGDFLKEIKKQTQNFPNNILKSKLTRDDDHVEGLLDATKNDGWGFQYLYDYDIQSPVYMYALKKIGENGHMQLSCEEEGKFYYTLKECIENDPRNKLIFLMNKENK